MKIFFILSISICGLTLLGAGCFSLQQPVASEVTAPSFEWSHVSTASVTASNGVVIKSCGGGGPIICAFKEDKPVGQMEFLTYDVSGEKQTINERIQDFYQNIGADRQNGCPKGFSITTTTPELVQVAGVAGTKARLEVRDATNILVERYVLYMTEQNNRLHVFNISGYEKGSCVSEEVDYTTIQNLESGVEEAFEAVVKTSVLPK